MMLRLSPFRSVDALTLISVINWRDLLHSPSVVPSGLPDSPSSCPLLPFLSAHPFIKRWLSSHLHSLNQPLSTRPCDAVLFSSRLSPPSAPALAPVPLIYLGYHLIALPVRIAGPPDQIPPYGQLSSGPLNEVSRPRALSLPITVSSHAKSSSPLPFVSGVSDRRPEQIRHQKTSYGGEHSFSRGCHPTGCAVVVTGDLPQTANVLPP